MNRMFLLAGLSGLLGCPLKSSSSSSTMPGSSSSSSGDDRASGASTGTPVTVPDLTGMSRADAESAIRAAGIRGELKIGNDPGSYELATAKVCTQNPGGGQQTSSTLFVTIRFCHVDAPSGTKQPELAGLPVAEATKRAQAAGYTGKIEVLTMSEYDASCKADTVCRYMPEHWVFNQERTLSFFVNRKVAISAPE